MLSIVKKLSTIIATVNIYTREGDAATENISLSVMLERNDLRRFTRILDTLSHISSYSRGVRTRENRWVVDDSETGDGTVGKGYGKGCGKAASRKAEGAWGVKLG